MTHQTRSIRPSGRLEYAARAGRSLVAAPYESLERTAEKVAGWRDARASAFRYVVTESAEARAHEMIGSHWPCQETEVFETVWDETMDDLAERSLSIGRGAFGGWDDGDSRLARLAWCFARHLRPSAVLETGVARGLTTRVLLEALERNGDGRLWSIDLPPLLQEDLASETAAAVPTGLTHRWAFVRGSSRRVLPAVVREMREIDLFVHDSMHTTRNVLFELEQVWPRLAPGGAVLVDDVNRNGAMGRFLQSHPGTPSMICAADDGEALIGCLVKPSRSG